MARKVPLSCGWETFGCGGGVGLVPTQTGLKLMTAQLDKPGLIGPVVVVRKPKAEDQVCVCVCVVCVVRLEVCVCVW